MSRLAEAPTILSKADILRLFAVVVAFVLVVVVGSWGGSTAFLSKSAPNASGQVVSETLRHAAMASAGRTTIAAARPSAKKSGFRGANPALPTSAGAYASGAEPGRMPPLGDLSSPREPALQGYLARAPPSQG